MRSNDGRGLERIINIFGVAHTATMRKRLRACNERATAMNVLYMQGKPYVDARGRVIPLACARSSAPRSEQGVPW